MKKDNRISDLGAVLYDIKKNPEKMKGYLDMAAKFSRYRTENILLVYKQMPEASVIADYASWKRVGGYVKYGTKGIHIFPDAVIGGNNYVFDLKDIGGNPKIPHWELLPVYDEYMGLLHGISTYRKLFDGIGNPPEKEMFPVLIRRIMKAENMDIPEGLTDEQQEAVFDCAVYIVCTRCKISTEYPEKSALMLLDANAAGELLMRLQAVNFFAGRMLNEIREAISIVQEVILATGQEKDAATDKQKEQTAQERSGGYGRDKVQGGEGRTSLSDNESSERPRSGGRGQIRTYGMGLSVPKLHVRNNESKSIGNGKADGIPETGEHGLPETGGGHEGGIHKEEQAEGQQRLVGKHTDYAAGDGDRGGAGKGGDNQPMPSGLPNQLKEEKKETMIEKGPNADAPGPFLMPGKNRSNFSYDLSEDFKQEKYSKKQQYSYNVNAIKLLRILEKEERKASAEEKKVLSLYSGWGGLSPAFDVLSDWKEEYKELRELLTEEEYKKALSSVNSSFFTPLRVTEAIHHTLSRMGFDGGNVLEPSMGIGRFFGTMPEHIKNNAALFGVEIDSVSGRIAKKLYPDADISIMGFEKTDFPKNFFDVIIGNIPFGDFGVADRNYDKHSFLIHDYFIAKSIDLVRPGGIIAFVTSKGTLDKKNPAARKYMAERADLIGAVRMPAGTFSDAPGVTSDIILLQKRERPRLEMPEWVYLDEQDGVPLNSYYVKNPEMMLGQMEYDGRFGGQYTVCVNRDGDFSLLRELNSALSKIGGNIIRKRLFGETDEKEESGDYIPAVPDVKNYTYANIDGSLYYRKNSTMRKVSESQKKMERISGMCGIRKVMRELMEVQLSGCTEDVLATKQGELNRIYDSFVEKYGNISSKANSLAFMEDADYPLLKSLEEADSEGILHKTKFFYEATLSPKKRNGHADNAVDALKICLAENGYVDLNYMEKHYPTLRGGNKEERLENLRKEVYGAAFPDPADGTWKAADEYLSGNVRRKLAAAQKAAEEEPENGFWKKNVEALENVQPQRVPASEIYVRIGTPWISPADYDLFLYELLDVPQRYRATANDDRLFYKPQRIKTCYSKASGEWHIENKSLDSQSVNATSIYGTSRMTCYEIMESLLNLRGLTVRDRVEDVHGNVSYVINSQETALVEEKGRILNEEFHSWIFRDISRREKYEDFYNENFNNTRLRKFDGSILHFPGMSSDIELREHQKNAVARILFSGNTLLAHTVGAGKSFEMAAACMEQKRLGLANKTLMLVPKALILQTASEFMRLYPLANILTATEKDFEMKRRKHFISRIVTGEYDCVIMSYSQFEKIPLSPQYIINFINTEIENLDMMIKSIREQEQGKSWTLKQAEAAKKRLAVRLEREISAKEKDDTVYFEELGIDCIMVDEAHNYKNLSFTTKMSRVAGINVSGAAKSLDLYMKCRYILDNEKKRSGQARGIVFATGTPVSNSMAEMYTMQKYLREDSLEAKGLNDFDSWAATFGEVTTALELNVEGSGFKQKSRFNHFVNLPELMTMFYEFSDVLPAKDLNLDIPVYRDGKPYIVVSSPDEHTKDVMKEFVKRAGLVRNRAVSPDEDNFLKITNDARLLGADARLLDENAPINPDGKLSRVAENIYKEYKKGNADGRIGCQLVFSDIGTPGTGKRFNVYSCLKEMLVEYGIPENEVAFIHDAKTDEQRKKLLMDVDSGRKKILIGSTDKCGTGVNVQTHIVAMHHVDCPWKPSSIAQREGRGLRQGNENKEVAVYRYVTEGTFDAYNWGIVENKQRFIAQVMSGGSIAGRTCEDIDEAALSYAEIKAVATGNPLIKEKMELDNEVRRLSMLRSSHEKLRFLNEHKYMREYPQEIEMLTSSIEKVKADAEKYEAYLSGCTDRKHPEFCAKIGGCVFRERKEAGEKLLNMFRDIPLYNGSEEVGTFRGFKVLAGRNSTDGELYLKGEYSYKAKMSADAVGIMIRLENLYSTIPDTLERLKAKLKEAEKNLENALKASGEPFSLEEEYKEKTKRLNELNKLLSEEKVINEEKSPAEDREHPNEVLKTEKNTFKR